MSWPGDTSRSAGPVGGYLSDPDGVLPALFFQQVPESKVVKNRIHLDVTVSGGRDEPFGVRWPIRKATNSAWRRVLGL